MEKKRTETFCFASCSYVSLDMQGGNSPTPIPMKKDLGLHAHTALHPQENFSFYFAAAFMQGKRKTLVFL